MSRVDRPAIRGTWLGRVLSIWNPAYVALLRGPLHWPGSRLAMVIEFRGARTGRTYRTPVHYVEDGDRLLATTADRWARNLRGGVAVRVWLRGRRHDGTAELIEQEQDVIGLHRRMIARRPVFAWLMGLRPPNVDEQLVRSVRAGRKAVVVHLTTAVMPTTRRSDE